MSALPDAAQQELPGMDPRTFDAMMDGLTSDGLRYQGAWRSRPFPGSETQVLIRVHPDLSRDYAVSRPVYPEGEAKAQFDDEVRQVLAWLNRSPVSIWKVEKATKTKTGGHAVLLKVTHVHLGRELAG